MANWTISRTSSHIHIVDLDTDNDDTVMMLPLTDDEEHDAAVQGMAEAILHCQSSLEHWAAHLSPRV